MLISVVAQIGIILFVCPAIWLIVKYDGWRESIGVTLGVIAVPFIAYTALRHGQWGIIIPCIVFIIATFPVLVKGIKTKYTQKSERRV